MRGRPSRGSAALATIVMGVVFLALTMTFPARALAQSASDAPAVERKITELEGRIDDLTKRIDFSIAIFGVIFGVIFAVGGGVSLYGFFKEESRTKKAFELLREGEAAAQSRATEVHEKFLIPSKETLELVNATLEISRAESERRTETIVARAKEALQDLHRQATLLISGVPEEDVHEFATNPTLRARIRRLAPRIEGYRSTFQEALQLTPPTLFILGMDFHLNQNFEESLDSWEQVVVDRETPDGLKSLAWYWIGREQNNLAKFDEAQRSFENARKNASEALNLELQRNILETKFQPGSAESR